MRAAPSRRRATGQRWLLAVDIYRRQLSWSGALSTVVVLGWGVWAALQTTMAGGTVMSGSGRPGVNIFDVEGARERHFASRRREATITTEWSATSTKQAAKTSFELLLCGPQAVVMINDRRDSSQYKTYTKQERRYEKSPLARPQTALGKHEPQLH